MGKSERERLKAKGLVIKVTTEKKPQAAFKPDIGVLYSLDIIDIKPNPDQPRKVFNEETLKELSSSIKEKGVLQPISVRYDEKKEQIYLIAGERRFRAAQMAGLQKIPALFNLGDPAEIALIENIQREDLKPVDAAEAMASLAKTHKYTHNHLAQVIGKSRSSVTEYLSLNKLSDKIREECRHVDIPLGALLRIARMETETEAEEMFERYKTGDVTSGQIKQIKKSSTVKKEAGVAEKRGPGNMALAVVNKMNTLTSQIKKIDSTHLGKGERKSIQVALETLAKAVNEKIGHQ